MRVKICKNLNCSNFGKASFCNNSCPKCGKELKEAQVKNATNFPCPKCKASVFQRDNYCGTCGRYLRSSISLSIVEMSPSEASEKLNEQGFKLRGD